MNQGQKRSENSIPSINELKNQILLALKYQQRVKWKMRRKRKREEERSQIHWEMELVDSEVARVDIAEAGNQTE